MRPTRPLAVLLPLALVLAAAPAASAKTYDVPAALGGELERVAGATRVAVRVPARLRLDFDGRLHAEGTATRRAWTLGLHGAPDCGANVCFLAEMTGERGAELVFRRRVRLARGITGRFKPLTCGASCSPPTVEWRQGGVRFSIQAKPGVRGAARQRAVLVRAARSAIRRAPR